MKKSAKILLLVFSIFYISGITFAQNKPLAELQSKKTKMSMILTGKTDDQTINLTEGNGKPISCNRNDAFNETWYRQGKDHKYYYKGENSQFEWIVRFSRSNGTNNVKVIKKAKKNGNVVDAFDGTYINPDNTARVMAIVKSPDSKAKLTLIGSVDSVSVKLSGVDRNKKYVSAVCAKRNAEQKFWYKEAPRKYYNFYYERTVGINQWEIRFLRNREHNIEVLQKMTGNYKLKDKYTGICKELHEIDTQ